jgi:hypothetical protein
LAIHFRANLPKVQDQCDPNQLHTVLLEFFGDLILLASRQGTPATPCGFPLANKAMPLIQIDTRPSAPNRLIEAEPEKQDQAAGLHVLRSNRCSN